MTIKALAWVAIAFRIGIGGLRAADYPQARISNGRVSATLNLPDPQRGYYRGTRFDWSGVVYRLEARGHSYFAPFYERFDPNVRDVDLREGVVAGPISAISGPVEEFSAAAGGAFGYADAQTGGTFLKIGVGVLRKPDEPRYDHYRPYEIVSSGKWSVEKGADRVAFTQEVGDAASGYGYVYRKTVRLMKSESKMLLEHVLRNTGQKPIVGNVYNHNFFVIDHQAVGPAWALTFPFQIQGAREMKGLAEARGNQIVYLKTLGNGDVATTPIQGFGETPNDYDVRVENRKTGAGVHVTGDAAVSRIMLWSVKTVACPELFVNLNIAPGQEQKWNITYEFYTVPTSGRGGRQPQSQSKAN